MNKHRLLLKALCTIDLKQSRSARLKHNLEMDAANESKTGLGDDGEKRRSLLYDYTTHVNNNEVHSNERLRLAAT